MTGAGYPSVSILKAGIRCRCPRCGQGKLYSGFLQVAADCTVCGLPLRENDSGDGPAVFIIFIMGFVVVGGALALELAAGPPMWLHMLIWIPIIVIGSAALLRPFKAAFIAIQFKHKVDGYGRAD
jgi:uncharacterized protein (DUF983 family)